MNMNLEEQITLGRLLQILVLYSLISGPCQRVGRWLFNITLGGQWQCWKEHDWEYLWDAPKFSAYCSRCGAKLRGIAGAHQIWRSSTPEQRRKTFGR